MDSRQCRPVDRAAKPAVEARGEARSPLERGEPVKLLNCCGSMACCGNLRATRPARPGHKQPGRARPLVRTLEGALRESARGGGAHRHSFSIRARAPCRSMPGVVFSFPRAFSITPITGDIRNGKLHCRWRADGWCWAVRCPVIATSWSAPAEQAYAFARRTKIGEKAFDAVLSGQIDIAAEEAAARQVVEQHYSTPVVAAKHAQFVREVCAARG